MGNLEHHPEATYPEMWPEMTRVQRLGMWGANLVLSELFEGGGKANALVSFHGVPGEDGLSIVEASILPGSTGDQRYPGKLGLAAWTVLETDLDKVHRGESILYRAPHPEGPQFAFSVRDAESGLPRWATLQEVDRHVEMLDALTNDYLNVMTQHLGDIEMLRTNRQNHGEERFEDERDLLLNGPQRWADPPF